MLIVNYFSSHHGGRGGGSPLVVQQKEIYIVFLLFFHCGSEVIFVQVTDQQHIHNADMRTVFILFNLIDSAVEIYTFVLLSTRALLAAHPQQFPSSQLSPMALTQD